MIKLNDLHLTSHISNIIIHAKAYLLQTWKLKEEDRLLDVVDPELSQYPEEEVLRFIKVALFCTQAAANQRPTMKQVNAFQRSEPK